MSHLHIDQWPIERLIPYARNARTHSDAQVAQIAGSIAEFRFNNPVLVDAQGGILAGHGRVLAARKLQLPEVPVIVLAHLSENQKRAYRLADNQLALNAGWDLEMLRLELEAAAEQGFDPQLLGFEQEQLASILQQLTRRFADPDEMPPVETQIVSASGDLWKLGPHRLLCGDGTRPEDLDRLLQSQLCHLVFTDPPYGVDYRGQGPRPMQICNDNLGAQFGPFLQAACKQMLRVSMGPVYICMSSGELHRLMRPSRKRVAIGLPISSGRRTPSPWGERIINASTSRSCTDGAPASGITGAGIAARGTCGRLTSRYASHHEAGGVSGAGHSQQQPAGRYGSGSVRRRGFDLDSLS